MTPRLDGTWVDALGTTRRLQALTAIGYGTVDLAARYGCSFQLIMKYRSGVHAQVRVETAEKFAALYDEASMIPGPSQRARNYAARRGWAPPLAWPEPGIDDPHVTPELDAPADDQADENIVAAFLQDRPPLWSSLNAADRELLCRELRRREFTVNAVALACRANYSTVANHWKRAG